jgi:hypothetical protein
MLTKPESARASAPAPSRSRRLEKGQEAKTKPSSVIGVNQFCIQWNTLRTRNTKPRRTTYVTSIVYDHLDLFSRQLLPMRHLYFENSRKLLIIRSGLEPKKGDFHAGQRSPIHIDDYIADLNAWGGGGKNEAKRSH